MLKVLLWLCSQRGLRKFWIGIGMKADHSARREMGFWKIAVRFDDAINAVHQNLGVGWTFSVNPLLN